MRYVVECIQELISCQHLLAHNNFNAIFTILSGLEKAQAQEKIESKTVLREDVYAIHLFQTSLTSHSQAEKAAFDRLVSPKEDFRAYKVAYLKSTGPVIPTLSVHLMDIANVAIKNQGKKV